MQSIPYIRKNTADIERQVVSLRKTAENLRTQAEYASKETEKIRNEYLNCTNGEKELRSSLKQLQIEKEKLKEEEIDLRNQELQYSKVFDLVKEVSKMLNEFSVSEYALSQSLGLIKLFCSRNKDKPVTFTKYQF